MDEDESLRRYGLRPSGSDLDQIRELLTQAALERRSQGDGDTELMKLCCLQLAVVLDYLIQSEEAGDFRDFSVAKTSRWYSWYYPRPRWLASVLV